jgi:hypothetical protein
MGRANLQRIRRLTYSSNTKKPAANYRPSFALVVRVTPAARIVSNARSSSPGCTLTARQPSTITVAANPSWRASSAVKPRFMPLDARESRLEATLFRLSKEMHGLRSVTARRVTPSGGDSSASRSGSTAPVARDHARRSPGLESQSLEYSCSYAFLAVPVRQHAAASALGKRTLFSLCTCWCMFFSRCASAS